ncbi:MAG: hypothetical protein JWN94_1923 [Betaproteobacteria bacterium]|nr:hypothetical protein [Betaproteobacteria bacterium]
MPRARARVGKSKVKRPQKTAPAKRLRQSSPKKAGSSSQHLLNREAIKRVKPKAPF